MDVYMSARKLFDKFVDKCPFAVMTRLVAGVFISEEMDSIFEEHRTVQYERSVKFSAIALSVADVALNFCDNFNQAYKSHRDKLGVAVTSYYDKIKATETDVSQAFVARSAERASALQDALAFEPWEILCGYRCLGLDGNVLTKTEKRLGVLRESCGAPLPGKVVARFDLQRQLFDRAYLLENGHALELSTCDRVVKDLLPDDVIIADRHYCIIGFLEEIGAVGASFVIRQHKRLTGELLGKRRRLGRTDTGMVYEQSLRLSAAREDAMVVRRLTVELDEPTEDGDMEVHVLTNLPAKVEGREIADRYRLRWDEENAFHALQMTLTCELASVGHPRAALFLFCMSMMACNLRQVVFAALFAEHSQEEVENASHFHLSVEVSRYTDGMLVALDDDDWREIAPTTPRGISRMLRTIARGIDIRKYIKSVRGPKKKKPFRKRNVVSKHVATAKLLGLTPKKHP